MSMEKPNGTGLGRIIKATQCSIDGISYAYRYEAAFRQELFLTLLMIPLAFFITQKPLELVVLIVPLLMLLMVECINSAIEAAIDRISTDIHPLSKQAKDLGSAAVFFTLLIILVCWLGVIIPIWL